MRFRCHLLCLIFLLISLPASLAAWEANIIVTAEANSQELVFGEHPNASDGFGSMDVAVPPLPPTEPFPVYLDAVFMIDGIFPRLTMDIKREATFNQWELKVHSDMRDIRLIWDISNVPLDRSLSLFLQNTNGTENIYVDMRTENSLELSRGLYIMTLKVMVRSVGWANGDYVDKGDVDKDGQVDSRDAFLILQIATRLIDPTEYQKQAADINNDGRIGSDDVIFILRSASTLAAPGRSMAKNVNKNTNTALSDSQQEAINRFPALNFSPNSKLITTWGRLRSE